MEQELHEIKNGAMPLILEAKSKEELEELKLQFLGRSGKLTLAFKELTKLPIEKRKEAGILANEIKNSIEDAISEQMHQLSVEKKKRTLNFDVTDPGIKPPLGHLHLITQAIEEITDIFARIGFKRVRYPEIEYDWYAFEGLNFPDQHPARDDWETFFIKQDKHPKLGPVVLTPHTSSGQIREMTNAVKNAKKDEKIEIKMLNIAKTYRRQSDVSHTAMFHQFETLVVGENISIADLKGTLDYFVKSWFGESRRSRIRPYHFQFTEPSFETDVSCGVCDGTGYVIPDSIRNLSSGDPESSSGRHAKKEACRLCKEGWLELGGAGMVHPNVLRNCGLDPEKYTGFASGWGVERVLMMKEGMELDDLRLLYSNKLEFLEQF